MQSGRAVFYFLLLIVLSASTLAEDGHLTDTANESKNRIHYTIQVVHSNKIRNLSVLSA